MSDEQAGLIHKKIIAVMRAVKAVPKDGFNKQQNYQFRSIEAICNALHSCLANNGVYATPEVLETDRKILDRLDKSTGKKVGHMVSVMLRVRFTFRAEDGSAVEVVTVGEGADAGDKASNKAMTAAYKYALTQIFSLPTRDDGDKDSPEIPDEGNSPAQRMMGGQDAGKPEPGAPVTTREQAKEACKRYPPPAVEDGFMSEREVREANAELVTEIPAAIPIKALRAAAKLRLITALGKWMRCRKQWRAGKLSAAHQAECWEVIKSETSYDQQTIEQADPAELEKWAIHYENLLDELVSG